MRDWVQIGGHTSDLYDFPTGLPDFLSKYQTYDLVIPVFHGVYGEDGQVTAFLKTLNCKYAYSEFEVHALCIDKNLTNIYIEQIGVNIPESYFVTRNTSIPSLTEFPLIVKPNK
jgi:D-alanine-D-alanine ligase-like ATP-grasp enzyme